MDIKTILWRGVFSEIVILWTIYQSAMSGCDLLITCNEILDTALRSQFVILWDAELSASIGKDVDISILVCFRIDLDFST